MNACRRLCGAVVLIGVVAATLVVSTGSVGAAGAAPVNDSFAAATVLSGAAGSLQGTTTGAGVEPGEPNHAGFGADRTVWFRFTPTSSGTVEFKVRRFDQAGEYIAVAAVGVYTGSTVSALTPVASVDPQPFWGVGPIEEPFVRFAAVAGTSYSVAVATKSDSIDPGDIGLAWSSAGSAPVNDMIAAATPVTVTRNGVITGSTAAATPDSGQTPAEFSTGCGTSVWYRMTPAQDGVLELSSDRFLSEGPYYRGAQIVVYRGATATAENQIGATSEESGSLSVAVNGGTSYLVLVGCSYNKFYGVETGPFELAWVFHPSTAGPNTVSVGDARAAEGATLVFTAERRGDLSSDAAVQFSVQPGTAAAGDFDGESSGTLYFPAGQAAARLRVPTVADTIGEANETLRVTLSSPTSMGLADTSAVGLITDAQRNEPTYTVEDINVTEGASAAVRIVRRGDLSGAGALKVQTRNSTAVAGTDYTAKSATVTFAPGQSSATVQVTTTANKLDVAVNKALRVELSAAVGGWISDTAATVTIIDDEGTRVAGPSSWYSIDGTKTPEGSAGTVTLRRHGNLNAAGTVHYATADGTATSSDYSGRSGTATFAKGVAAVTVSVPTTSDAVGETHESVQVNLSAAGGGVIEDAQGVVVILDDDEFPGAPQLEVGDISAREGASATFTVLRSGDLSEPATVKWSSVNGTAVAGSDFSAGSGVVTFAAGEWARTVSVAVTSDGRGEPAERFSVTLSAATNASVVDADGVATIAAN